MGMPLLLSKLDIEEGQGMPHPAALNSRQVERHPSG
jgi:hypothetical protein